MMAELLDKIFSRFASDLGELEESLFNDLSLNQGDLEKEKIQHASLFAKWAMFTALALKDFREQKRMVELEAWPRALERSKFHLEEMGEKTTVAAVDAGAKQDGTYQAAIKLRDEAEHLLDIMKRCEQAFWHRKTMLELLSFRTNLEKSADPKEADFDWSPSQKSQEASLDDLETRAKGILKGEK